MNWYIYISKCRWRGGKRGQFYSRKTMFARKGKRTLKRDVSSGPVVKNSPSNAGDLDSIPGCRIKSHLRRATETMSCNERCQMLRLRPDAANKKMNMLKRNLEEIVSISLMSFKLAIHSYLVPRGKWFEYSYKEL